MALFTDYGLPERKIRLLGRRHVNEILYRFGIAHGVHVYRLVHRDTAYDIAVPVRESFHYPLAAAYATDITATIQSQLDAGQFRTQALFGLVKTLRVPCDQLTPSDQGLESLRNVNRADDYFAALASAGFDVPSAIRRQLVDQDAAS